MNLKQRLKETRNDGGYMSAGAIAGSWAAGVLVVALIIWFLIWITNSFGSTDGGHVGVVRNGGPFDNTKIVKVLPANSGRTNIGMFSTIHAYPTSQRFFTIDSNGGGDSDDVVQVPTADGVQVGIEGTAYFTLNVNPAHGYKVLTDFDNKYGTRKFKCTGSNDSKAVWDGDKGFSCFLEQIVSPVINNDLRVAIGDLRCADLQASCSLVQNSGQNGTTQIDPSKVGQGNVNLAKVEQQISTSLQDDLNSTLGGDYLTGVRFNLAKIDLPASLQKAIDKVQASYAGVSDAQAKQRQQLIQADTRLKQAKIDAQANEERQRGYNNCPTCGDIDKIHALPPNVTTLVLGSGSGISISAK